MKLTLIRHSFIALVLMLTISGCATKTVDLKYDAGKFSAVVTSSPDLSPRKGSKISWEAPLYILDKALREGAASKGLGSLVSKINQELVNKGYVVNGAAQDADYRFHGAVYLGGRDNHQAASFMQLFPELSASIHDYEEGTLLLVLTQGETNRILWQGAIQVYVMGEDLSEQERQVRISRIVKRLMGEFPAARS